MEHSQRKRRWGVALVCSAALAAGAAVGAQGHAAPLPAQVDVSTESCGPAGGGGPTEMVFGGWTHRHAR
jgi:hypothetical protein